MMTPELITSIASLAGGAFSGLMVNNQKMLLASIDAIVLSSKRGNDNSNDAAARNKGNGSWLQRIIAPLVIFMAFYALWWAAKNGITTTYLYETVSNRFLFWGGNEKVTAIVGEGLVIPPYVKYSVIVIVNFLFGASVTKLRRV